MKKWQVTMTTDGLYYDSNIVSAQTAEQAIKLFRKQYGREMYRLKCWRIEFRAEEKQGGEE